jgi:hypothetical protein
MRPEQTVGEMAQETLFRQARALAGRTGESLLVALETVVKTPAGMQLEELRSGPHHRDLRWLPKPSCGPCPYLSSSE